MPDHTFTLLDLQALADHYSLEYCDCLVVRDLTGRFYLLHGIPDTATYLGPTKADAAQMLGDLLR